MEKRASLLKNSSLAGYAEALINSANEVGKSFSGSWHGYHARVYYQNFGKPPPGAHFSKEWGLNGDSFLGLGSSGQWIEYDFEYVKSHIIQGSAVTAATEEIKLLEEGKNEFNDCKSELLSILENEIVDRRDDFVTKQKKALEDLLPLSQSDLVEVWRPKGQFMTRDTVVIGQGTQLPPHIAVLAEGSEILQLINVCLESAKIAKLAVSHLARRSSKIPHSRTVGNKIFIGHGGSLLWREFKDFVADRLGLDWEEFNRISSAGIATASRLEEMLDSAAFAFLIMTAEDEAADGSRRARQNVIHEAGLFQGRLGFKKAVVLLEDGCEEFSNIHGLGQIRFPKGNISAAFEEARRVLEREKLLIV